MGTTVVRYAGVCGVMLTNAGRAHRYRTGVCGIKRRCKYAGVFLQFPYSTPEYPYSTTEYPRDCQDPVNVTWLWDTFVFNSTSTAGSLYVRPSAPPPHPSPGAHVRDLNRRSRGTSRGGTYRGTRGVLTGRSQYSVGTHMVPHRVLRRMGREYNWGLASKGYS